MPSPRPRLFLEKLKRHASALVLRPAPPKDEECHLLPIPTVSPYIHVTHSHSTVSDNDYDDDDISLPHQTDDFLPYVPLVSQYERAANNSLTTPRTIFSRPVSAITAPLTPPSPSPSTVSTASTVTTPRTPIFTTHYSSSASSSSLSSPSRWSVCTDDDSIPAPTPYPQFKQHPFAKGSIQVVRHSISMHENLLRAKRVAPAKPPPSCPLPSPPPSPSEEDPDDRAAQFLRVRQTEEWTLTLNLPPSRTPRRPKPPASPFLLQPPPIHRRASQPHMHPAPKPKPKIVRVQIEPENALDIDKDDWTLSLPLALPPPPGIVAEHARRRHKSQPGPGPAASPRSRERSAVPASTSVQSLPAPSVSARAASSVATVVPRRVHAPLCSRCSRTLPSPPCSVASFADSGVGMGAHPETRWVDGVRLPPTPDPEMPWKSGELAGEEADGVSMVSGHSMYYSARSSVCFSSEA